MYPIEKYRFYRNGNKVIAVSTYAGKTVRGVANCDANDEFDFEKGKRLAAARCAVKVAEKRVARAERMVARAEVETARAERFSEKMEDYLWDSCSELGDAYAEIDDILAEM